MSKKKRQNHLPNEQQGKKAYLQLLSDLCECSTGAYEWIIEQDKDTFARYVRQKLNDKLLEGILLNDCPTRDAAILAVRKRMHKLDQTTCDPAKSHTFQELVDEAVKGGLQPHLNVLANMKRKELIKSICPGRFPGCPDNDNCLWRLDCREMHELPPIADLVGANVLDLSRGGQEGRAPDTAQPQAPPAKKPKPHSAPSSGQTFLEFPKPEQVVEFLDMLVGYGSAAGLSRQEIVVRPPAGSPGGRWGLRLPVSLEPHVEQMVGVFGGRSVPSLPRGEELDPNSFLERIRLQQHRVMPENLEAVFVLFEAGSRGELEASVHEAYQSFPRGLNVECQFFPDSPAKVGGAQSILILFDRIKYTKRAAEWVSRLPKDRATAFYPLSGLSSDAFFCQWGYMHPAVALPRLYDREDNRYVLMVQAIAGSRRWVKIPEARVREALRSTHRVISMTIDQQRPVVFVLPPDEEFAPFEIPLRPRRSRDLGFARRGALVRRIDATRRALADLEAKYEKIHQAAWGMCRVALAFHHDPSRDGQRLPAHLRRFLSRAYQPLENFSYLFHSTSNPQRHLLFSHRPVEMSDVLLSCADEVFVQDVRWNGWGLNMFLQHDVELSPRLDDPAMAEQLKAELQRKVTDQEIECWLVAAIQADKRLPGYELAVLAIPKSQLRPLPEAMRFVNLAFSEAFDGAVEHSAEMGRQGLEKRGLEIAAQLEGLHRELLAEVTPHIETVLAEWQALHDHANRLRGQVQASHKDVKDVEAVLRALPPLWDQFIQTVLNIHLHMIRSRCELFETLKLAGQEFDNTQQEALTAFGQADVVIGQAKTNVSDGYQTMQAAEKRAADAFALLQGQCSSFLADCKECQQRIQQANRQLTEQYDLNRNIANELEQGTTQVEKDLGPLNQLRREIEETKRKLARLQGEVDDVKQQKERHQGALAKAKQKLADLQAERGRKKEEIADLERQTHQTEAQFRGTNEQVAKLEKFLDKLREAAKSAPAQRAKFVDSVNQLEELLQHRPSTIGRVKASWQFLKALRTAPRGFFPNEAGSHPQGGTPNAGT